MFIKLQYSAAASQLNYSLAHYHTAFCFCVQLLTSTALTAAHCLNRLKLHKQPQQLTALCKAVPLLNTCRHYFPNITQSLKTIPAGDRQSGGLVNSAASLPRNCHFAKFVVKIHPIC